MMKKGLKRKLESVLSRQMFEESSLSKFKVTVGFL